MLAPFFSVIFISQVAHSVTLNKGFGKGYIKDNSSIKIMFNFSQCGF